MFALFFTIFSRVELLWIAAAVSLSIDLLTESILDSKIEECAL